MRRTLIVGALIGVFVPDLANADPVQITSGAFIMGRPLIGTERNGASMIWLNPPPELVGGVETEIVEQSWMGSEPYTSTLPGTTEPVLPLTPGPVPVGGTFETMTLSLQFTGGTFTVPSVFPPTDEEDLYTLTEPFEMSGHWRVNVEGSDGTTTLFDHDIVGSGKVRFVLGAERSSGNSIISALVYEFAAPAPVPEPSTMILCGLALPAVARQRHTRRRKRAPRSASVLDGESHDKTRNTRVMTPS
jgi:hypothetical protein